MGTKQYDTHEIAQGRRIVRWDGLGKNAEVGAQFNRFNPSSSLTVTFNGIFDGAKVRLQGAIEDDMFTLNDPQGNSLTSSSPKIEAVIEKVTAISPVIENPGAKTDVTVTVLICG